MAESTPKTRWFHLSPDRLIIGLLAVEILLFLSERFQWFAFNEKKGWTVLIAVAAVCLVVVVMLLWPGASLLSRWRFQFSVRSLAVLVVAVAIPCCWLTVKMREAERQRKAVKAIEKAGGWVMYHHDVLFRETAGPAWLRKLLGEEFFADEVSVQLGVAARDEDLECLKWLTRVETLNLSLTQITDSGLKNLKGLNELRWLELGDTKTTDAGLENVKGLTKLENLDLPYTQVTGGGLEYLKGLTQLKDLDLYRTQVTDAGLKNLKGVPMLEELNLAHTSVTDAGLQNLKGLTSLRELMLNDTQVTDVGLEHLTELTNLHTLILSGTQVTEEGIEELRGSLPDCFIFRGSPRTPTESQQIESDSYDRFLKPSVGDGILELDRLGGRLIPGPTSFDERHSAGTR